MTRRSLSLKMMMRREPRWGALISEEAGVSLAGYAREETAALSWLDIHSPNSQAPRLCHEHPGGPRAKAPSVNHGRRRALQRKPGLELVVREKSGVIKTAWGAGGAEEVSAGEFIAPPRRDCEHPVPPV